MSDGEEDMECPLCMEDLDITDRHFKPCQCGYQMCRFCWNHIMENINGRCPQCREPYDSQNYTFTPPDPKELAKAHQDKRKKERKNKKQQETHSRKQLSNVRVIQRNLVYVTNLALSIAKEELLRKFEYFGQYGRIDKIVINKNSHYNIHSPHGPSVSAYITFCRKDDALACIKAVDSAWVENRVLRASFGTTKYCTYFLRHLPCNNPDCMYLHELGNDEDSFTKDDIAMGKHHFHDQTHPNTILQAPPDDDNRFVILPRRPVVVHLDPNSRQLRHEDHGDLRSSTPGKIVHDGDSWSHHSGSSLAKSSDSISSIPLEKPILPASASWAIKKPVEPEKKDLKADDAKAKAGMKGSKITKQQKLKQKAVKQKGKVKQALPPAAQQPFKNETQKSTKAQVKLSKATKGKGGKGHQDEYSNTQKAMPPGLSRGWGNASEGSGPEKGNVFDASGGYSAWRPDKQAGRGHDGSEWSGDVPSGWGEGTTTPEPVPATPVNTSLSSKQEQASFKEQAESQEERGSQAGGKGEDSESDFGFDPWKEMQRGFEELLVDATDLSKVKAANAARPKPVSKQPLQQPLPGIFGAWGKVGSGEQADEGAAAAAAAGRSRYDFAQDAMGRSGLPMQAGSPARNPEELHNAFRKLLPNVNVRFVETESTAAAKQPETAASRMARPPGVGSSVPPPGIKWNSSMQPPFGLSSAWAPPQYGSSQSLGSNRSSSQLQRHNQAQTGSVPSQWGGMTSSGSVLPSSQSDQSRQKYPPQYPPGFGPYGQGSARSAQSNDSYMQSSAWSSNQQKMRHQSQPSYGRRPEPSRGSQGPPRSHAALHDSAILGGSHMEPKAAWNDQGPQSQYNRGYGQPRTTSQQLPPGINPNALPRRPGQPPYSAYGQKISLPPGLHSKPANHPGNFPPHYHTQQQRMEAGRSGQQQQQQPLQQQQQQSHQ